MKPSTIMYAGELSATWPMHRNCKFFPCGFLSSTAPAARCGKRPHGLPDPAILFEEGQGHSSMAARSNEFASTASVNRWPDVGNKVTHGVVVETNPTELAQKNSVVHGSVAGSQYFCLRRLDPRCQSQLPVIENTLSDALGLLPNLLQGHRRQ